MHIDHAQKGKPAPLTFPGALLGQIVLPALGLTVTQAATDLLITRQTLHRILSGSAAISPAMALRLEKFCGVSSRFWLERQIDHELRQSANAIDGILSRIPARILPAETQDLMGKA